MFTSLQPNNILIQKKCHILLNCLHSIGKKIIYLLDAILEIKST